MAVESTEAPASRHWWIAGFVVALILGAVLRLAWVEDMEFKYDECWMYWQTQGIYGKYDSAWLGNYASNGTRNPGMSVWVFLGLAKIFNVSEPTELARAVQIMNIASFALLAWFVLRVVPREEREPWLWAVALGAVNPLSVCFHRKIWTPSVLPMFMVLFLIGWFYRRRQGGAFLAALMTMVMGQIHPTGHIMGLALTLWVFVFDRRGMRWKGWIAGNVVGGIPLIPWLYHVYTGTEVAPTTHWTWKHAVEGKFWIRWFTEAFGLGLDYQFWQDFTPFLQYPRILGVPTYFVALLHLLVVATMIFVLGRTLLLLWRQRDRLGSLWVGRSGDTAFTQAAMLWSFGILLTLTCMPIHRHYMIILFPLEFLWVARLALAASPNGASEPAGVYRPGRVVLAGLFALQFLLTTCFLGHIHDSGGTRGEYGIVYRLESNFRNQSVEKFYKALPTVGKIK